MDALHTEDGDRDAGHISTSVEVLRSSIQSLISDPSSGMDGDLAWPISPHALALLYTASAEHGRAINIKAESAYGGGLIGERAEEITALTDVGTAELFVSLGIDLETYGNAFLQMIRSNDGERVIGLRRLPAITMSRYRGGYLQRIWGPNGAEKKVTFTTDEMLHLRDPCPFGGHYSRPTWIGAHGMLDLARSATDFNASFFKNGAMPEYAVIFKGATPGAEQKKAITDFFRDSFQGVDQQHRTLLMHANEETTIEIKRLTAEVKDGDFLKLLDAARDRMPVAHGVPSRLLGIMTAGQLGGGGEFSAQMFGFERLTLAPKRRRMLDQLRPLLSAFGLKPGFDEDGLASDEIAFRRLDLTPPKDDAESLPDLVNAGIITADQARTLLALPIEKAGEPSEAASEALARSVPQASEDRLVALLERL